MRRLAVLLLPLVIMVAGCTKSMSEAEYRDTLVSANEDVIQAGEEMIAANRAVEDGRMSYNEAAEVARDGQGVISRHLSSFERIDPPEGWERTHKLMLEGYGDFERAFTSFIECFEERDSSYCADGLRYLRAGTAAIEAAADASPN